jgi:hypothetical protein
MRYRAQFGMPPEALQLRHTLSSLDSRVAQRSKALHLSAKGVTTIPGSNPGCITSVRDWV